MSSPLLTIQRLSYALDSKFSGLIDLSDISHHSQEQQRNCFLTRSLAAYSICMLTDCRPEQAALSVTDGYDDEGIDAIYFDSAERTMYLVQSKWGSKGNKTIDLGEVSKFLRGVQFLILPDFTRFNEKIRKREDEINSNLLLRSDVKVVLVLAYNSPDPLGGHIEDELARFVTDQNRGSDVFFSEVVNLKGLYSHLSGDSEEKVSFSFSLSEWGMVDAPYRAYYGQAQISDIADWSKFGRSLFAKNLRYFQGPTEVNEAMLKTLSTTPENFWYFNNGITMLCRKVVKVLQGGARREFGVFDCKGVSVVNGAQTVGVIWELERRNSLHLKNSDASVSVRIISLEGCPEGFGSEVTTAANTQNRIQHRDFAALDPEQQRLANEMTLDKRRYAFKSGDPDPIGEEGCNIEEATIALACANVDIGMAAQAKREIGMLWQNITKAPYTTLFNSQLGAPDMWRAVLVMRRVDAHIKVMSTIDKPRAEHVAVHGNRFILHMVFRDPEMRNYQDPNLNEDNLLTVAQNATERIFLRLVDVVQAKYEGAYLANVFKNAQHYKDLEAMLSNEIIIVKEYETIPLFPEGF